MSELDEEAIQRIHDWAQKRLDANERWRRTKPLREAMTKSVQRTITETTPELTADATADSRKATMRLEAVLAGAGNETQPTGDRFESELAAARRRTQALREWLESLP